jgi:hypothetical protein
MKYKDNGGDKQKEGNCQDFVEDVLKRLGMKHDFTGPLGDFLKKLREKGTSEMEFSMTTQFREKFGITEKKEKFTTHAQLDRFVEALLEKYVVVRRIANHVGNQSSMQNINKSGVC